MSTISERAKGYGVVGEYLLEVLGSFPDAARGYGRGTFVSDLVKLQSSLASLRQMHRMLPIGITLLALPFPLQIQVSTSDILLLVRAATRLPFNYVLDSRLGGPLPMSAVRSGVNYAEKIAEWFPVKAHAAASTKVNLVLANLFKSMIRMGKSGILHGLVQLWAHKLSEDQCINGIIYGFGLANTFGSVGWDIAAHFMLDPKAAKNVSVAIKALGAHTTREGALLAEADVLQGRGAGPISLHDEASYRCDPDAVAGKVLDKADLLRPHVQAIIDRELRDRDVALDDLHHWWTSRWAWCVNGSQTTNSSRLLGLDPHRNSSTHTREYRRMASEALESEPITNWDGTTSVSSSIKLENGKERAIFACDTRSYFAFSYLLAPLEKAWRHERVILDPGAGGHIGIARRVRECQRGGGVNLMLDYDDFNSHHSTDVLKMVTTLVCDKISAPSWLREAVVSSFDKMYISSVPGDNRVKGTLMSGHRGTTFFNSILNAAYVRASVGGAYYDNLLSLHAGDDVYIRCNTLSDCDTILRGCRDFGCRMNPTKQSIGYVGAEFLRIAIGKHAAYGYYARSVAGFVSGNWTTFDPLAPTEALANAIAGARTMSNRGGLKRLGQLIAPAMRYTRGIGVRTLIKLLDGDIALEGSPVFNTDGWLREIRVTVVEDVPPPLPSSWARNATRDYLTDHLSDVELTGITMAGVDPLPLLVASSYSKGLNKEAGWSAPKPVFRRLKPRLARGFVDVADLLRSDTRPGVLADYPVIRLFENRLSEDSLRTLVGMVGGDINASNIREEAFGQSSQTKNIIGFLSYGDAASLSSKTKSDNIFTLYHCYI
ncbi:RNA-dependent RNA polymerase [Corynespora cassiicola victorivirus 1]|nr:RNA-dependent RNA polymerase [Corynespora cassiicola victorivirus 1]